MIIYIDGKFYPEEEAKISVFDHGLLYGDGVFEGIRAYEGRVFKLEDHLARLEDSAKAILLKLPWTRAEIQKAVLETCQKNKMKSGYLRLVVTRGKGTSVCLQIVVKNPLSLLSRVTLSCILRSIIARG